MNKNRFLPIILFSLGLCFVLCAMPFFQTFAVFIAERHLGRTLRDIPRWKEIVMHCSFLGLLFILSVSFLNYTKTGKNTASNIKTELSAFMSEIKNKKSISIFLFLLCFYFICFYKLIISDFFYNDDIWRAARGSRSWIGLGRYISEFFSVLIHNNLNIQDISPLPQFISIFIMAASTFVLCYILNRNKIALLPCLALSAVFISPFFSQNFSYKYDSPYMAIAAFLPVVPFLFRKNIKTFIFTSFIFLVLDCMSYQPGTSFYIVLSIYFVAGMILSGSDSKSLFFFLSSAVFSFVIAMITYKVFFVNEKSLDDSFYAVTKVSVSAVFTNMISYLKICISNFGGYLTKFAFSVISLSTVCFSIKNSKCNKFLSTVIVFTAFIAGAVLSFGPYLIFKIPLYEPRALMGFNFFAAVICFVLTRQIVNSGRFVKILSVTSIIVFLYSCIVFLFTLGSCFSVQKNYQNFRTTVLLSDLNDLIDPASEYELFIDGSIGVCRGNDVAIRNYPILKKLIPVLPAKGSIWNDDLLCYYNFAIEETDCDMDTSYNLVKNSVCHDIYKSDNKFYVILKE